MLMQPLPDQPTWDEARLVAHVDELIAAQEAQGVDHKSPSKKQRLAAKEYKKQSTSVFNPSTVWFGKTPIVLREDHGHPHLLHILSQASILWEALSQGHPDQQTKQGHGHPKLVRDNSIFLIWLCASHIFHCILQVMALTLTLTCL